jgi:hypothetical protein
MEIYNSEKKVDIGLGLLTNPNKKKKKKHFIVTENNKEKEIESQSLDKTQEQQEIIEEFSNFILNNNSESNEYDELMSSLILCITKLIKYKKFMKKIDNLQ